MSRKYPYENGAQNTRLNRERQRYAHTMHYHTEHMIRERVERVQARIDTFRESDPEGFARAQRRNEARAAAEESAKAEQARKSDGDSSGGSAAAGGAIIAGLTVGEVVLIAVGVVVVAYCGYRLYKWYKAKP